MASEPVEAGPQHATEQQPRSSRSARLRLAGLLLWLLLLGTGYGALLRYGSTPGTTADSPPRWPQESALQRDASRDTVLMFVHPECFCTRASLAELQEVQRHAGAEPRVIVVARPHSEAMRRWRPDPAVPGAGFVQDLDGRETQRFGAETSGLVLMYDAGGVLRFRGGITGSRGHRGDNPGRRQLLAALSAPQAIAAPYPVFGCSLEAHELAQAASPHSQTNAP